MGELLTGPDLVIFFGSLIAVMGFGLWAGRKEDTAADYYLAGRKTRWWGVAGSIFGSNVSANHIVGMMAVGFSVGFAQSHFEVGAIAGLLLLCYGFLPMYRKLKLYTLSEYLSRRYDDRSRVVYAAIMLAIMVLVGMVAGFYIGSRSLNILLKDGETAVAEAVVNEAGEISEIRVKSGGSNYASIPKLVCPTAGDEKPVEQPTAKITITDGVVTAVTWPGSGYDPDKPPPVTITGGASFDSKLSPGDIDPKWYRFGILLMALVTGTYTILGGLKAVIVTDVIQSVLLLAAAVLLAVVTFWQPEIGGWSGMTALDGANPDGGKLHLYLPTDHPKLPWTSVFTGIMVLHFYYWGTNQWIVQRAISARDDREARIGIITAGFFKLLIPFISIGTGIAAFYLLRSRSMDVAQDVVFVTLMAELIAPLGWGLLGLVAAGMIGAILSTIDSMMNSSATIITFDIYQRYVNPEASERRLIWIGRVSIVAMLVASALLTIFMMDPNSKDSFFLMVVGLQGKLIAGVIVAFALGMLWRRATATAAVVTMLCGVAVSYGFPPLYKAFLGTQASIAHVFGKELAAFHTVAVAAVVCFVVHVIVSLMTQPDPEKSKLTWVGQGIVTTATLKIFAVVCGLTLAIYAVLAVAMVWGHLAPAGAAWLAAVWTFAVFAVTAVRRARSDPERRSTVAALLRDDLFWAGLLAAAAVFIMFNFY